MASQASQPSVRSPAASARTSLAARLGRSIRGYLFILPTFLFLGYFMYLPAWTALSGAFTYWDGFNDPRFVGMANFERAFNDPVLRESLGNNIIWAVLRMVIYLIPPFIVAEMIFHIPSSRMQYFYRTLFVFPLIVPEIVDILLWKYFYRGDGLVNLLLGGVGLESLQRPWLSDPDTALYAIILMKFPWIQAFNLLIFYAGLQAISTDVMESSQLDGSTGLHRVWTIDIPLVLPQFKLLSILAIISSVQVIIEPLLMTNGGPGYATYMPGLHMFFSATKFGEFGYSMAIAFMMFIVILILTILNMRFLRTRDE